MIKSRLTIRQSATILYLVLLLIPLVGVFVSLNTTRTNTQEQAQYWQLSLVESLAREIDQHLTQRLELLQRIAKLDHRYNRPQALEAAERGLTISDQGFDAIYFTDPAGYIINARFDRDTRGRESDFIGIRLPDLPVSGQGISWSATFLSAQSQRPTVRISLPANQGRLVGELDLSALRTSIAAIPLPEDARLFLVDKHGKAVFPDHGTPRARPENPLVQAALENRHILSGYGGNQILSGATSHLNNNGWYVCFEQPHRTVFALYYQLLRQNLLTWGLALLILSLALLYLHRRIILPLEWLIARSMEIPEKWLQPTTKMPRAAIDLVRLWLTLRGGVRQLRQRERALVKAQRAAEQASQAKSNFLTKISHELRTPLNGILGSSEQLLHSRQFSEQQTKTLRNIHNSGRYLLKIINDILDYAKSEVGKLELVPVDVKLLPLLDEVCTAFKIQAENKGLTLHLNYATESEFPEAVHTDPLRLRQVLYNLLGNAVKFTERGEILLDCRAERISAVQGRLHFSVEDTGPGIPPAHQETIFSPFFQSGERLRYAEGSGLGLSISRELVHLLGGQLTVESPPPHPRTKQNKGSGSRFSFSLLVKTGQSSTEAEPTPIGLPVDAPRASCRLAAGDLPSYRLCAPLLEAAREGDMEQLEQLLDSIDEQGDHPEFVELLRDLAADYCVAEIKKILESAQNNDH